jgi:hypothetical protein
VLSVYFIDTNEILTVLVLHREMYRVYPISAVKSIDKCQHNETVNEQ